MRSQLPAVAVVAVGAVVALLAVVALMWFIVPSASEVDRADALAAQLRCPDCQGLSVADSQTASAREIRRQIGELVGAGATDAEVRAHFVDRYGEWILLAPTLPAAWILPFAALALGVAGLGIRLVRRSPVSAQRAPVDEETRRRIHDEVEALDA